MTTATQALATKTNALALTIELAGLGIPDDPVQAVQIDIHKSRYRVA